MSSALVDYSTNRSAPDRTGFPAASPDRVPHQHTAHYFGMPARGAVLNVLTPSRELLFQSRDHRCNFLKSEAAQLDGCRISEHFRHRRVEVEIIHRPAC
jgi:hypothetical protein